VTSLAKAESATELSIPLCTQRWWAQWTEHFELGTGCFVWYL